MKYMKRKNIYKASNVTFNPETLSAYSYGWWKFVAVIDGKVIFNNYRYSNSTSRHQRKVRALMFQLGIRIDVEMPVPEGLQSGQHLENLIEQAEEHLCNEFLDQKIKSQRAYQRRKERLQNQERQLQSVLSVVPNEA